jgi:hypothetical protein
MKRKTRSMKTRTIITTNRGLALGAGCALALFAFTELQAVDIEKGATRLMQMGRPAPVPEKSDYKPLSCEKCKDVVTQVPDWSAKGGQILMAVNRPTKAVVQHQCQGCSTKLEVVGHGNGKRQVAKHTCTSCGSKDQACCSTSEKNSRPTRGMERQP